MRHLLHIVTKSDDDLLIKVVSAQREQPDCTVKVVDLTESNSDYAALVEEIFAADGIAVW